MEAFWRKWRGGGGRVIADFDTDANSPMRPEDIFINS